MDELGSVLAGVVGILILIAIGLATIKGITILWSLF